VECAARAGTSILTVLARSATHDVVAAEACRCLGCDEFAARVGTSISTVLARFATHDVVAAEAWRCLGCDEMRSSCWHVVSTVLARVSINSTSQWATHAQTIMRADVSTD